MINCTPKINSEQRTSSLFSNHQPQEESGGPGLTLRRQYWVRGSCLILQSPLHTALCSPNPAATPLHLLSLLKHPVVQTAQMRKPEAVFLPDTP